MPRKKTKDYGFKPWQKANGAVDKHFTRYHSSFDETKLWWGMKSSSRDVYHIMMKKYNGRNDEELQFPYDCAEAVMSKPTFHNGIKELIECGYIEFVEHNRFTRKSNVYKFSVKWRELAAEKIRF
jgi:hypothetical protein